MNAHIAHNRLINYLNMRLLLGFWIEIDRNALSSKPSDKKHFDQKVRRRMLCSPLQYIASMSLDSPQSTVSGNSATSTKTDIDSLYSIAVSLLNQFYPQRTITITTRDPDFITPEIKAKLRRKQRLMRAGRIEEAIMS
jgi:hypothetical protein